MMQFLEKQAFRSGRPVLTEPSISVYASGTVHFTITTAIMARMGWVPGDHIRIGYDPTQHVFGLKRLPGSDGYKLLPLHSKDRGKATAAGKLLVTAKRLYGIGMPDAGARGATQTEVVAVRDGLLLLRNPFAQQLTVAAE